MIIGNVKEYGICNITSKKLEKEELFSELIKLDSNLKNKILEVLNNNGYVIGLKNKNVLKVVYIFEMDTQQKILKYKETLIAEEIEKSIIEEFEKLIVKDLKEVVTSRKISKAVWKDNEIVPNKISSKFSSLFWFWVLVGLVFGIIFNHVYIGLLFGGIIGWLLG